MNRETLQELLKRQPFESIEIVTTDGAARWIRHPEFAILQQTGLIVAQQGTDRFDIIPYSQIASVGSYVTAAPE